MGVNRLKVLVQNRTTGKILVRRWSKAELIKSMAWLKRMNARGSDILVKPDEGHALVLISALTKEALAEMNRAGFEPAAIIETARGDFQAWVKLEGPPASDRAVLVASDGLAVKLQEVVAVG